MSDQHQAGGSETCGDPYPQSYTSGTEVQMRLCARDKGHAGEHRWRDYGWGHAPEAAGSGAGSTGMNVLIRLSAEKLHALRLVAAQRSQSVDELVSELLNRALKIDVRVRVL